jgi:hypothetical protein
VALDTRLNRFQGRSSDVASLLSTKSLYLPWKDEIRRRVADDSGEETVDQPPLPTVVQVNDGEHLPRHALTGQPHQPTKTFAELQQILIRDELAREAVGGRRVHAEHGEPDAIRRFQGSHNDPDRTSAAA